MRSNAVEEDESFWIPLVEEDSQIRSSEETNADTTNQEQITASSSAALTVSRTTRRTPPRPPPRRETVSDRLESKMRLKESLVDHPLDKSWRRFLHHLSSEIWLLDLHLRFGIVLVVVGAILQTARWTLSFNWFHPRTIILLLVFSIPFFYLAPKNVEEQLQSFARLLFEPGKVFDLVNYVDPDVLRRACLLFLLLPTVLEARTFGFLSETMAEGGVVGNVSVGLVLFGFFWFRFQSGSPRECIQRGIHILYGCALISAVARVDIYKWPALAGPFCLATGTLLLSYRDDDMGWLSRPIRHALRLTLRDVLASVGESVREDEMLQLAMLRWIVDYWSSQPHEPPTSTTMSHQKNATSRPTTVSDREHLALPPSSSEHTAQVQPAPSQELQWEELQPMLDMTTDQMIGEIPLQASDRRGRAPSETRLSISSDSLGHDNGPLYNLRSMLLSLDVDERAKPAVMAYKQVVEAFPPTHLQTAFFSVIRRCPATSMLLYRYAMTSDLALVTTITLLPFAIMEAFRVLHWAEACERYSGAQLPESQVEPRRPARVSLMSIPIEIDPMFVLLSGDTYHPERPPALFQVWSNVRSSVSALEMGLTAARCAQTTAVAADFAHNIISLAQFGVEVSQHGWMHGLAVMVQELVHLHSSESPNRDAKYASAAMNAVRNGHIVARNVRALAKEDEANPVIDPLLGVLSAIVGRGWLWGKDEQSESTVTIDEIPPYPSPPLGHESLLSAGNVQEVPAIDGRQPLSTKGALPLMKLEADERLDVSASEPDGGMSQEDEEDLSELMQLIADAFEQDIIVETEKNAYVETILEIFRSGTHGSDTRTTVEQMERSLRALLESPETESTVQVDQVMTQPSQGSPVESTSTATDDAINETSASVEPQEEDPPHQYASIRALECVLPSPAETPNTTEYDRRVALSLHASPEDCSTDEPSLQANERQDGTAAASRSTDEANAQQERKGDDWVKWVGGGLAVIGAAAAGIAIANAAQAEDNRSRMSTRTGESTVVIEEIDDDDENEWISVSASNTD